MLCVFFAACEGSRTGDDPEVRGRTTLTGHFIRMPEKAGSPGQDVNGGAVIVMTTNLPDGTLVYITSEFPGSAGWSNPLCCPAVRRGSLTFRQQGFCIGFPKPDMAAGFDISAIVVPDLSLVFRGPGQGCDSSVVCGAGPRQPLSVQRLLGPNLEKIKGGQVTTIVGTRALVASAHFAWPSDVCRVPRDIVSGVPRICRPTLESIDDGEGGANLRAVVGSVISTLSQPRLCTLYDFMTREYRTSHPWVEFRERTKAWIEAHRPLMGLGYKNFLSGRIVAQGPGTVGIGHSPQWLKAEYFLRGRKVGHARFVASTWHEGITKWEIEELVLQ
jgi:hypothetical protein